MTTTVLDAKNNEVENKISKFTTDIHNPKIKQKELVNKSNIS